MIIFLTVLIVGLLAVSSVSANEINNETTLFDNDNSVLSVDENNEDISLIIDGNVGKEVSIGEIDNSDNKLSSDMSFDALSAGYIDNPNIKIIADNVILNNRHKDYTYKVKVVDGITNQPLPEKEGWIETNLFIYDVKNPHSYHWTSDKNGIITFIIPDPLDNNNLGKHAIEFWSWDTDDVVKTSYITIAESKAEVFAPPLTVEYKDKDYFDIFVSNAKGKPIKNLKMKVTVGKSKTYILKTNKEGFAGFYVNKFKIGKYKVTIKSLDKKYKFTKTSKITIKKKVIVKTSKKTTSKKTTTKKKSNTKTVTKGKFKAKFSISVWREAKKSPGMWDKKIINTGIKKYNGKTVYAYISTYGTSIRVTWGAGGHQLAIKYLGKTTR